MALTDRETVKKVIQSERVYIPDVENNRVQLTLFEAGQLEFSNITLDSESVKIIRVNSPQADSHNPITLNDQDSVDLDAQKIVPDTVVVASDLILTTVYVENDDYVIDYLNGTIERTSLGSAIANGGTVYVWYLPFVVLVSGDDYNFDYNAGTLKRRAGSTIPNKATLYVDYNHAAVEPADNLLEELIIEMESFIEPRLKGGFSLDSDDPGLKSASTNFVLYLYCLSASLKELRFAGRDNSDDIARRWQDLSEKYLNAAKSMFSKFLNVSTESIGGMIQNRFTTSRTRKMVSPTVSPGTRRH